MFELSTYLTYIAVVLGLFLIPGPAVLLVLARLVSGGRRVGIATGFGVAFGYLIHTLAPQAFRQAIFAELLSPKTALFFLAFLPQFVNPGSAPPSRSLRRWA